MSEWCELCRDHYSVSHWDQRYHHKIGADYGWHGAQLAIIQAARLVANSPIDTDHLIALRNAIVEYDELTR